MSDEDLGFLVILSVILLIYCLPTFVAFFPRPPKPVADPDRERGFRRHVHRLGR
jgi:hypothetical protein